MSFPRSGLSAPNCVPTPSNAPTLSSASLVKCRCRSGSQARDARLLSRSRGTERAALLVVGREEGPSALTDTDRIWVRSCASLASSSRPAKPLRDAANLRMADGAASSLCAEPASSAILREGGDPVKAFEDRLLRRAHLRGGGSAEPGKRRFHVRVEDRFADSGRRGASRR